MRKILAIAVLILVATAAVAVEVGDTPAVSVRSGEVRSAPGFLAPIISAVSYGDSVEVLEIGLGWVRVRVEGTGSEGWLHESAVAAKESLRLEVSGDTRATTSREIALAGRGFNEKVEAEYQSQRGLDFSGVDAMEDDEIELAVVGEFFASAGLGGNLGVQP